ncbi:MAG: PepSY-like domain-containing protein [Bacteroides sp.]|nr:PepSY-like domain-containing protein [Bacteroides sp.]
MKPFLQHLLMSLLLSLSLTLSASNLPEVVEKAFKQMYPTANRTEWYQMAGCYVAKFIQDSTELDVWFNPEGVWVMTETDVESFSKIPSAVSESFHQYQIGGMHLSDIRIVSFPHHPSLFVFTVEVYNSDEECQLFYSPDGTLQKELNTTQTGAEIYPGLFE